MKILGHLPLALVLVPLLSACTPGSVANAVKPEAPKIPGKVECDPNALGGTISPLIIDWPSTLRGDLETVMAEEQVVVVSFSCDKVKVLQDCRVAGRYGYRGISVKQESTLIEGADNIHASFGGTHGGASADYAADAKLDLAMMLVGKKSTTRISLHTGELEGECEGATHYVRRADVGAFAMTTGTSIKAGAAVEVFGQGLSGSSSAKDVRNKTDGDPKQCKGADAGAESAPSQCGALIRVSLTPIKTGDGPTKDDMAKTSENDGRGCPSGFVFSQGACQRKSAEMKSFLCEENNATQCSEQCKLGDFGSCGRFASYALNSTGNADSLMEQIASMRENMDKACSADEGSACAALFGLDFLGVMGKVDTPTPEALRPHAAAMKRSFEYGAAGCVAGERQACEILREVLMAKGASATFGEFLGVGDSREWFLGVIARGCDGGSAIACNELARASVSEEGEINDPVAAMKFANMACLGGYAESCILAAVLQSEDADACMVVATNSLNALCRDEVLSQVKGDIKTFGSYMKRACVFEDAHACKVLDILDM